MQSTEPDSAPHQDGSSRPAKRQRVARACAPCRSSKLRCDGQQPACSTCSQLDKTCSYEPVIKRRGLRSGYVRALELLWGLTIQELEDVEPVVESLLSRLTKHDLATSIDRADTNTAASAILDRWKHCKISRDLNDLLNDDDGCSNEVEAREIEDESHSLRANDEPGWVVVSRDSLARLNTVGDPLIDRTNPQSNTSNPDCHQLIDTSFNHEHEPPAHASQLLQLFLKHTQSWLPIFERHVLLRTSLQRQRDPSSAAHSNRAALLGVYAYSVVGLSHLLNDSQACQHAREDAGSIYAKAYSMLPLDSEHVVELGHVQCALLLSLTRLAQGFIKASWRLVKLAVLMMKEITGHRRSNAEHDALAKAWLGCFVLDTMISTCAAHTPLLRSSDVVSWSYLDDNHVEEWQPWQLGGVLVTRNGLRATASEVPTHSISLFLIQVKLMRIYNESLRMPSEHVLSMSTEVQGLGKDFSSTQDLAGLASILRSENVDVLRLPPSLLNLCVLYTLTIQKMEDGGHWPHHTSSLSHDIGFLQLEATKLQMLRRHPNFQKQLPMLNLYPNEDKDTEFVSQKNSLSVPNHQYDRSHSLLQSSELSHLILEPQIPVITNIQATNSDTDHSRQISISQNVADAVNPSGPTEGLDTDGLSFDSYMDAMDAPFLDFLDTLDDRSTDGTDLFSKSLGFSF